MWVTLRWQTLALLLGRERVGLRSRRGVWTVLQQGRGLLQQLLLLMGALLVQGSGPHQRLLSRSRLLLSYCACWAA